VTRHNTYILVFNHKEKHMKTAIAIAISAMVAQAHATTLTSQQQGQTQAQGQTQGQWQGQAQDQKAIASASTGSEARSSVANTGNTLTVTEAPIPANTTQTIRQSDYTVKNVPNVLTGSVYPTAPCMGSSQVGAAGIGFGVSVGTSWTDDECGIRETARSFSGMGLSTDALAILCTSKYAAAAPSCGKAKEE
jgi:hypothetical protein